MMQEMGISAIDAPTGLVTPVPIRLWFTAPELSYALIDDNHNRPLHPLMGPFFRRYLSRFESMDDDDNKTRHPYTGLCDTRKWARTMFEDWEIDHVVEENDIGRAIPNQHLRRNREHFSTPHTARDPNKVDEIEVKKEDLQGMIQHPPKVGAVWFHHERESINTSHACDRHYIPRHHLSCHCQRTKQSRRR